MCNNSDTKIITIQKKTYTTKDALVAALNTLVQDCKNDGYTNIEIYKDNDSIKIHATKAQPTVYEIQAKPIILLPAVDTTVSSQRHNNVQMCHQMRNYHNRMQNIKYNVALRNYKGRKR